VPHFFGVTAMSEFIEGSGDLRQDIVDIVGAAMWVSEAPGKVIEVSKNALSELAFRAALSAMGVDMPLSEPVTIERVGLALGDKVGEQLGVPVGNILDGDGMRGKIERVAIEIVIGALGGKNEPTRMGLAEAIKKFVADKIEEELTDGAGDLLAKIVTSETLKEWLLRGLGKKQHELKTTKKAIGNRERQARYRANHKRVLVS
jgi:hypothetical protein